jgi:hypothetical protein
MTRKRHNKNKKTIKKMNVSKLRAKSCKSKKYNSVYGRIKMGMMGGFF